MKAAEYVWAFVVPQVYIHDDQSLIPPLLDSLRRFKKAGFSTPTMTSLIPTSTWPHRCLVIFCPAIYMLAVTLSAGAKYQLLNGSCVLGTVVFGHSPWQPDLGRIYSVIAGISRCSTGDMAFLRRHDGCKLLDVFHVSR